MDSTHSTSVPTALTHLQSIRRDFAAAIVPDGKMQVQLLGLDCFFCGLVTFPEDFAITLMPMGPGGQLGFKLIFEVPWTQPTELHAYLVDVEEKPLHCSL